MTFKEKIFNKLPDLFDKNEATGGCVVRSGFDCPVGWEQIVEDALTSINGYVKGCTKSVKINADFYDRYDRFWMPVYNYLFRALDTDDGITLGQRLQFTKRAKKPFSWRTVTEADIRKEKAKTTYKLREKLKAIDNWIIDGRHRYMGVPVREVKIDQIKEKFGTLRIYISGGDEHVSGIIYHAECLSAKTCMFTGQPGERGAINGWIVTATKEELERRNKSKN